MLATNMRPFTACNAPCRTRRAGGVRCFAAQAVAAPSTYKLNINNCVDKAHEAKEIKDIVQLSPAALQGLGDKADSHLAALNINTIEQLGTWKHYKAARAIAALAETEEEGKRPANAAANINGILDKAWEAASLADILAAPPSALQGLGPKSDEALSALGVKSVGDLAAWKFAAWSDALTTLAEYERPDFSSA